MLFSQSIETKKHADKHGNEARVSKFQCDAVFFNTAQY